MRQHISAALLMLAAAGGFSAHAQMKDEKVIRVVAEGDGPDREKALKAAFVHAVQQAAGTYAVAREALKPSGDAVQEVATFSNGYILWYKALWLTDGPSGWKRLRIVADVARGKFEARLKKAGLWKPGGASAGVDTRPLFAEVVTRHRRQEDAGKLLAMLLERAPSSGDVVKSVSLLPVPKEPRRVGSRFEYVARYKVEYDLAPLLAYNRWLDEALKRAGFPGRETFTYHNSLSAVRDAFIGSRASTDVVRQSFSIPKGSIFTQPVNYRYGGRNPLSSMGRQTGALALLTDYRADGSGARTTWAVYRVDLTALKTAEAAVRRASRSGVAVTLRAVGARGKALATARGLQFTTPLLGKFDLCVLHGPGAYDARFLYHVSPLQYGYKPYGAQFEVLMVHSHGGALRLSLADLEKVTGIEAAVERIEKKR